MMTVLEAISTFNVLPTSILLSFFTGRERNLKFIWKHKNSQRTKVNPRKVNNAGRITDWCNQHGDSDCLFT